MTSRSCQRAGVVAVATACSAVLFATTAAAAPAPGSDGLGDPYYPKDGNGGYDVANYDLSFSYDPPSRQFDGTAVISAKATEDLSAFNLDLYKLTVSRITVNGEKATWTRSGEHELTVQPKAPLREHKKFTVTVEYGGVPQSIEDPALGKNGWQYGQNGAAFAAGEPHSAASWYPVNDSPLDKATYTFAGTLPEGWSMIANGTRLRTLDAGGGGKTWRWRESVPMASYLATVGIDKWTFERDKLRDGTPVVSAYSPSTPKQAKRAEARLPEVLDFLASKFGKYPQDAAGGIFVSRDTGFSLETAGRPTYSVTAGDLGTIIHENAHQWYGDSVSVKHWRDVCLNECFASYAGWLWDETKNGADLDKQYDKELDELAGDTGFWSRKLYDMGAGNEFTGVYSKGPLALHALRLAIGDRDFFHVLRHWPQKHRDGNASWPEFERYVQHVAHRDLRGFFDAWFHRDTEPAPEYKHPERS